LVRELFDLLVFSTNAESDEDGISEKELPEDCQTQDRAGKEDEGYFAHGGSGEE
tara:strand:- start:1956 stop:2117 length:162 start_codon:yes stop_codon:yes gene_type:complete